MISLAVFSNFYIPGTTCSNTFLKWLDSFPYLNGEGNILFSYTNSDMLDFILQRTQSNELKEKKKKKHGKGSTRIFILVLAEVLIINLGFLPAYLYSWKIPSFKLVVCFHCAKKTFFLRVINPGDLYRNANKAVSIIIIKRLHRKSHQVTHLHKLNTALCLPHKLV